MTDDQRGFMGSLLLLLGIILLVPIVFVLWLIVSASMSGPSVKDFYALKGQTKTEAISRLKEIGFECAEGHREANEPNFAASICQFDQATIAGPCFWSLKLHHGTSEKIVDVTVLSAVGQCGGAGNSP